MYIKGVLRFRETLTIYMLVHPIHVSIYYLHLIILINDCFVRVCIWVLGFTNYRLLEHSWTPLSFALWIVAK